MIKILKQANHLLSECQEITKIIAITMSASITLYTFNILINDKIEKRVTETLNNNVYVNNLSKILRPFLIFDEDGIIIYDHGASETILNIKCIKKENEITIYFNRHVQNPPLLIVVGDTQYSYKPKRVKNNGWRFLLTTSIDFSDRDSTYGNKYILEILP